MRTLLTLPVGLLIKRNRKSCHAAFAGMAFISSLCCIVNEATAQVPSADVTLQPVITQNLPVFTSLTGYAYLNDNDAVSTNLGGTQVYYDAPLYYPFNANTPGWWDNLVAEQIQGRLPVVLMPTRGAWTLDPADMTGPGELNPRRLTAYTAALARANATSLFKVACFVDSPAMVSIYNRVYDLPTDGKMDLSNPAGWEDVVWLRTVKPWFDTVPSTLWYRINNRPVIQWWGMHPGRFSNHYGNARQMLQHISDAFNTAYGVRPYFIIPDDLYTASNQDGTVVDQPDVLGLNGWFGPPIRPYSYIAWDNFISGCAVPGFINPNFFNPTSDKYGNPNQVIPANKIDGSGVNGDTLIEGLEQAVNFRAHFTLLEGWNDVREWAGFYRAIPTPRISFPSQYMNLVRQYTDLRTVTLRLEAEGADQYFDTTAGNSNGQVFRRTGDLDVRTLSGSQGGWAVNDIAVNEWIQFNKIYFSPGNYKFPVRYASATPVQARLRINGTALATVTLPATGGTEAFSTYSLGVSPVTWGVKDLRVEFLTAGAHVDWLFVKKYDPMMTLRSVSTNSYVCAELGGDNILIANRAAIGAWERFSANGVNGGVLSANDVISLQSYNGLLLCAEGGGSGVLAANRRREGGWEKFTLVKADGGSGALVAGDVIALRSANGRYVTVASDSRLNVTGTAIGDAQKFTIGFGQQ